MNVIVASGADVYVGGNYYSSGIILPCFWKNGTRVDLPPISTTYGAKVTSITVSGEDVYVGGSCDSVLGECSAGYWKDRTWVGHTPLRIRHGGGAQVSSLFVIGGSVYAGCY